MFPAGLFLEFPQNDPPEQHVFLVELGLFFAHLRFRGGSGGVELFLQFRDMRLVVGPLFLRGGKLILHAGELGSERGDLLVFGGNGAVEIGDGFLRLVELLH